MGINAGMLSVLFVGRYFFNKSDIFCHLKMLSFYIKKSIEEKVEGVRAKNHRFPGKKRKMHLKRKKKKRKNTDISAQEIHFHL